MLALYDAYFGRRPDGTYGDELEAYFAITPNTLQFGAKASLYAAAYGFSIEGYIGFDVLVPQIDVQQRKTRVLPAGQTSSMVAVGAAGVCAMARAPTA